MPKSIKRYSIPQKFQSFEVVNFLRNVISLDNQAICKYHSCSNSITELISIGNLLRDDLVTTYNFLKVKNDNKAPSIFSIPHLFKWATIESLDFNDPTKTGFSIDIDRVKSKLSISLGLPYNSIDESIIAATQYYHKMNDPLKLGFRNLDQISTSIGNIIKVNSNQPFRDIDWEFSLCQNRYRASLSPRKTYDGSQEEVHRASKVTVIYSDPILKFIIPETYGNDKIVEVLNYHKPDEFSMYYTSDNQNIFNVLKEYNCRLENAETEYNITKYIENESKMLEKVLSIYEDSYLSLSDLNLYSENWKTNISFERDRNGMWLFEVEIDIDAEEEHFQKIQNFIGQELHYKTSE